MQTTARQRWTALTLLAAIEFMILLDTSIVNIALLTIQAGLHFSETDLGWVQNIYQLIFGAFLLFGRRKLFLLGLALFTLSSLLAGEASTAAILLLARALQGLGSMVGVRVDFDTWSQRNRLLSVCGNCPRPDQWTYWPGITSAAMKCKVLGHNSSLSGIGKRVHRAPASPICLVHNHPTF